MFSRIVWLFVSLCCTLIFTSACQPSVEQKTQNHLFIGVEIDPDNANPLVAPYALSGYIIDLINPGLARRKVTKEGLVYEPALAKSWTFNEDLTELTYILRDDLLWEDGVPLTSADVAFTMELMADSTVASNWLGDAKNIRAVLTPDPHTVVFQFHESRNRIWQQGYTFRGILPKHTLEGVDRGSLRGHESARKPLSSGPFRLTEWKHNQYVRLQPNPKAPKDWSPSLDYIILKIIPESQTQLLALQKGDLDMVLNVQFGDIAAIEANPRLRTILSPADYMIYIGYNLTKERYQDPKLRKALTLATDRKAIIDKLYTVDEKVYAQTCEGTVAPNLTEWVPSELTPNTYQPEAAAALLDASGWIDEDGDGIREKNGEPLSIRLMMQNGNEKGRKLSILIQNQWRKVGVELVLDVLDATAFDDRARRKQYDALLWAFGNNPKIDLPIIWKTGGRYNWFGYSNPEVDRLLDAGVSSVDPADAKHAFKEAQRKIHQDNPVTFLLWVDGVMALDKRFQNTSHTLFNPLFHAEQWQVAKQEEN